MPQLPDPTSGTRVSILERPLRFSFWPMHKGSRRYGLQSNLFAVDPWTIIRDKMGIHFTPVATICCGFALISPDD